MSPTRRWARRVPEEIKVTGTVAENGESTETASPMIPGLQVTAARELLPGFVLLPKVLSLELQQQLLDTACRVAAAPAPGQSGGWYRCTPFEPQLNDGNKARFWDRIDKFPADFRFLGEQLALAAGRASPILQQPASDFEPRVGALNFYTGKGRMNWHKGDYNFVAKKDRPIVMASVGDTAEFGYKMQASDPDSSVHLESGDVIVFGGVARDLVHAMLRVFPQTAPRALKWDDALYCHGGHRVSLTWRDVGVEDGLTFNSDERLGLTVTENTLPRYLPRSKGAFKGRGKGYSGYRKGA